MKKLIFIITFCVSSILGEVIYSQASVSINISSQPLWGPVGYDYVEYYYLPDIESYYYVPGNKYIYLENGRWLSRSNLPFRYRSYDVYKSRKIVINEPRPYLRHNDYKVKFVSSNEGSNQQIIRDSHETKYFVNKKHPEHSKYKDSKKNKKSGMGQGNSKGQGKEKKHK